MNQATNRLLVTVSCLLLALASAPTLARGKRLIRAPDSWTLQAGSALKDVQNLTIGIAWNWQWARQSRWGHVAGYTELTASQWRADLRGASRSIHQVGINPTFRWHLNRDQRWFVDFGIGLH